MCPRTQGQPPPDLGKASRLLVLPGACEEEEAEAACTGLEGRERRPRAGKLGNKAVAAV